MKNGLILLVEDNPVSAELALGFLRMEGFTDEVVLARDGVEAIDYLFHTQQSAEEMPRLVLLDLNLPRIDGFGVLKKIRQEERTKFIPVVMLTASSHPDDVRRAYELGANGYLDKLTNGMRWDEMVRAAARFWARMNLTPYSLVGQGDSSGRLI
jgi:two-component system, response regulator